MEPGGYLLVVGDITSFAARFGNGLPVAGAYSGTLDNAGETLRLDDAFGEKILEFAYADEWQPSTDGLGRSLAIADDSLSWRAWGDRESWRASRATGGSPGRDEDSGVGPAPNHLVIRPAGAGYCLQYAGGPGGVCEIERSLDLVRWERVFTGTVPSDGLVEFVQSYAADRAAYYRAIER